MSENARCGSVRGLCGSGIMRLYTDRAGGGLRLYVPSVCKYRVPAVPAHERVDFLGDAAALADARSEPRLLWPGIADATRRARRVQGRHGLSGVADWAPDPAESAGAAVGFRTGSVLYAASRGSLQGNSLSGKLFGIRGGASPVLDMSRKR